MTSDFVLLHTLATMIKYMPTTDINFNIWGILCTFFINYKETGCRVTFQKRLARVIPHVLLSHALNIVNSLNILYTDARITAEFLEVYSNDPLN